MNVLGLARSVKRGVKLLDKRVPNWRKVLRAHSDEFDLADGEHCILGTLEHHSGRMKVLNARKAAVVECSEDAFERAKARLNLAENQDDDYGFNAPGNTAWDGSGTWDAEIALLQDLWIAEFE